MKKTANLLIVSVLMVLFGLINVYAQTTNSDNSSVTNQCNQDESSILQDILNLISVNSNGEQCPENNALSPGLLMGD